MSANHWTALDHTFSQLLPTADVRRGRERFAQRAAALSDIYLRRFAKTSDADFTRHLTELRHVHRMLAMVLSQTWTSGATKYEGLATKDTKD